ncbi:MAG: hypothetical protein HY903_16545 [Deltaproteobacteria bacterium]|nr:hypothetical protein [Deltaproteobacteria bacterium]
MVGLAVVFLILSGTIVFLIAHARLTSGSFDRGEIQRGGRAALSVLADKLGSAGLGLPRMLAIKSYVPNVACGTVVMPKLEVASLDFRREWTLAGTSGAAGTGTLTLANPITLTPAVAVDVPIPVGRWLFLYQGAGPGARGMAAVGTARGSGALTVAVDSTNYSTAQSTLDLAVTAPINGTVNPTAMLLVDVNTFGVNCSDNPAHPYLYWQENGGSQSVLANNIDTRPLTAANPGLGLAIGDVLGLRFRFLLDTNGDGQIDATVAQPSFNTDPSVATNDDVAAIEVTLRIRSENMDPQLKQGCLQRGQDPALCAYRVEEFTEVIRLSNLNTRAPDYIFVHNSAI